ncbi:hypothetical protein CCACVL1_30354, partial [Corchorus capsularis]
MGTTLLSGFSWKCHHQQVGPYCSFAAENRSSRAKAVAVDKQKKGRRSILVSGVSVAVLGFPPGEGLAVVKQGLLAGRIPGLSEPDEQAIANNIVLRQVGGHIADPMISPEGMASDGVLSFLMPSQCLKIGK